MKNFPIVDFFFILAFGAILLILSETNLLQRVTDGVPDFPIIMSIYFIGKWSGKFQERNRIKATTM